VTYGVTTSRAHLNRLEEPVSAPGEIVWEEIVAWMPEHDAPAFAGRYFLGTATQSEVDAGLSAGTGFCLWAHGEGGDSATPKKIVPLQRADPERQSTPGDPGQIFGFQDATALIRHLDLCLAVGDLEIVDTKQILVFLDVADGTALSREYWASWATTIQAGLLHPARLAHRTGVEALQPLIGAIHCAFAYDVDSKAFLPAPGVRDCLDEHGPRGFRSRCHGFWARELPGDPGLADHSFDWLNIGEYKQPWDAFPHFRIRVPVRYLRWFNGPEGLPIPEGPLRDTLSLVTLDWPARDASESPLGATFTATNWRADARTPQAGLTEIPVQFGVDKNRDLSKLLSCFANREIEISCLPAPYSW